jgi:ElaB/YqjD/DUF883 family membrane-anchored ribosome-binding protein
MADNATTGTTGSKTGSGWTPDNGGLPASGQGAATATATSLAQTAQEYAGKVSEKVSDAAVQAKDYVTDKVSVVSDKIKEIDFAELSDNAKEYARQNPGQAILISAGVGLVLGLLIRGRR